MGVGRPPGLQGAYECEREESWGEPGQRVCICMLPSSDKPSSRADRRANGT
jgi:hypothetical protein